MSEDHGMANAMGVEELAAYLADTTLNPPIADLATLDGYLSALVVGPRFIHPQQFLPEVLGPKADLSLTAGTEVRNSAESAHPIRLNSPTWFG
jgi:yecA family protein